MLPEAEKTFKVQSRSSEVIYVNRCTTAILCTLHSNNDPILYRFWEEATWTKNFKFSICHLHLMPV